MNHPNDKDNNRHTRGPELRSPKVRNIIAGRPPAFARYGTVAVTAIMLALIAWVLTQEWPHGAGETVLRHLLGPQ